MFANNTFFKWVFELLVYVIRPRVDDPKQKNWRSPTIVTNKKKNMQYRISWAFVSDDSFAMTKRSKRDRIVEGTAKNESMTLRVEKSQVK